MDCAGGLRPFVDNRDTAGYWKEKKFEHQKRRPLGFAETIDEITKPTSNGKKNEVSSILLTPEECR